MDLVLCTSLDLTGNLLLNALLPRLPANWRVRLVLAHRRRTVDRSGGLLAPLWHLERTLPLRLQGQLDRRGIVGTTLTFRTLIKRYVHQGRIVSTPQQWRHLQPFLYQPPPDLLLTLRFGFLIPASTLKHVPRALNMHPGRLPDYAGQYPLLYAWLAGERQFVLEIHHLLPQADAGGHVARSVVPHTLGRSHFWHRLACYQQGLNDHLDLMLEGVWTQGPSQPPASIHSWPQAHHIQQAACEGFALHKPSEYLDLMQGFCFRS